MHSVVWRVFAGVVSYLGGALGALELLGGLLLGGNVLLGLDFGHVAVLEGVGGGEKVEVEVHKSSRHGALCTGLVERFDLSAKRNKCPDWWRNFIEPTLIGRHF